MVTIDAKYTAALIGKSDKQSHLMIVPGCQAGMHFSWDETDKHIPTALCPCTTMHYHVAKEREMACICVSRAILLTSSSHVVPFGGAMSEQVEAAGAGAGAAAGVTTPGVTTGDGNTVCVGELPTGLAVAIDTGEYATGVGEP